MKETLGQQLARKARSLRELHDLSLDEAAKRIGITKSHLWEFEKGRSVNPTLAMLEGIASAYGISLSQLIGNERYTKPKLHPFALKVAAMIDAELNRA